MSGSQSPDYPDDMRDLFEDSKDENAEKSGEQSPGPSTHEESSELKQADTKRKLSEVEINLPSLSEGGQEELVCFLLLIIFFNS